jgi:hypothetical protein
MVRGVRRRWGILATLLFVSCGGHTVGALAPAAEAGLPADGGPANSQDANEAASPCADPGDGGPCANGLVCGAALVQLYDGGVGGVVPRFYGCASPGFAAVVHLNEVLDDLGCDLDFTLSPMCGPVVPCCGATCCQVALGGPCECATIVDYVAAP